MIFTFRIIDNVMEDVKEHFDMKDAFEEVGETFDQWDKIHWERDQSYWIWCPDSEGEETEYNDSRWVVDFGKLKERGEFPTHWRKRNEYFQSAIDEIRRVKNLKILLK